MGRYKRYDPAFKESAVKQALEGDRPYIEVARDLGVGYQTFHLWIRKYEKSHMKEKVQTSETLEEENKRLKKENERLRMEREILKKATAFFANESKRDINS
jgi:transposase